MGLYMVTEHIKLRALAKKQGTKESILEFSHGDAFNDGDVPHTYLHKWEKQGYIKPVGSNNTGQSFRNKADPEDDEKVTSGAQESADENDKEVVSEDQGSVNKDDDPNFYKMDPVSFIAVDSDETKPELTGTESTNGYHSAEIVNQMNKADLETYAVSIGVPDMKKGDGAAVLKQKIITFIEMKTVELDNEETDNG